MGEIVYLRSMTMEIKKEKIIPKLGYADMEKVENAIKRCMAITSLSGAYRRINIISKSEDLIEGDLGININSKYIAKFLSNSEEFVFMAATLGKDIVELIYQEVNYNDAATGIILDVAASYLADYGLDFIQQFMGKILKIEGKTITNARFSPGYGDVSLKFQKVIFDFLNLETLGVEINSKYMLMPEKTVLAIAGIERIKAT